MISQRKKMETFSSRSVFSQLDITNIFLSQRSLLRKIVERERYLFLLIFGKHYQRLCLGRKDSSKSTTFCSRASASLLIYLPKSDEKVQLNYCFHENQYIMFLFLRKQKQISACKLLSSDSPPNSFSRLSKFSR